MMAGQTLKFSCTCGKVQGHLSDITPRTAAPITCHCDDCRRALVWLGQNDTGAAGVTYLQTTPARVHFDAGEDTLAAFTWKNKRLLRWYAPCCNASLFNTLDSPKWAFVSLNAASLAPDIKLGPVKTQGFMRQPNGRYKHTGLMSFMLHFAKRTIGARVSGAWRKTPLFDAAGAPVAPVRALTHEDRATAQL